MRRTAWLALLAATAPLAGVPAALAAGPPSGQTVTTNAAWTVTASSTDDPMATPTGPVAAGNWSPRRGCAAFLHGDGGSTGGEGIVSLSMYSPGTDWSSEANTSTTVDVSVDGGPAQQIVLFAGAAPFRYEGFVGHLTGGAHCVALTVRPDLSHTTTVPAEVVVDAVSLSLVPPRSGEYMVETHAPVLYGRSTSALGDTPLVTFGQSHPDADGVDTDLSYTVIWTHEDVGDGVVAAYEWGLWGRMTDIETVLQEKVAPGGRILAASYLSCGCEGVPVYPDVVPENTLAGGESYKAYPGSGASPGLGYHLALRDATGNNDTSATGTTPYRFQLSLVAAPAPGQAREVAMDENPWTYRISNDEVVRETEQSSDPGNFLAGQYPQYLVVDIDSSPTGTGSVSIAVQLDGRTWYSDDYQQATAPGPATTFPFYNGGHGRTVIKLPVGWHSSTITALRLTLNASSPQTPTALGPPPTIDLVEVTPAYSVVHRPVPTPEVRTGTQIVPSGLGH